MAKESAPEIVAARKAMDLVYPPGIGGGIEFWDEGEYLVMGMCDGKRMPLGPAVKLDDAAVQILIRNMVTWLRGRGLPRND